MLQNMTHGLKRHLKLQSSHKIKKSRQKFPHLLINAPKMERPHKFCCTSSIFSQFRVCFPGLRLFEGSNDLKMHDSCSYSIALPLSRSLSEK